MKKLLLCLLLAVGVILSGCAEEGVNFGQDSELSEQHSDEISLPEGDPKEVFKQFKEHIFLGRFELAYELLSDTNKKVLSKKDLEDYFKIAYHGFVLNEIEETSWELRRDYAVDGVIYPHVYVVTLLETVYLESINDTAQSSFRAYVVNDNGEWKMCIDDTNEFKEDIFNLYYYNAILHIEGEIRKQDYGLAEEYLKKALERKPDHKDALFRLAYVRYEQGKYDDETIDIINKYIKLIDSTNLNAGIVDAEHIYVIDEKGKAKGLNLLGAVYYQRGEYETALRCLEEAYELDEFNQEIYINLQETKGKLYELNNYEALNLDSNY